jgi:hypothetical protein
MPSPSRVFGEIAGHPSLFFTISLQTLVLAALGLALDTPLGIGMAAAAWTSRIIPACSSRLPSSSRPFR